MTIHPVRAIADANPGTVRKRSIQFSVTPRALQSDNCRFAHDHNRCSKPTTAYSGRPSAAPIEMVAGSSAMSQRRGIQSFAIVVTLRLAASDHAKQRAGSTTPQASNSSSLRTAAAVSRLRRTSERPEVGVGVESDGLPCCARMNLMTAARDVILFPEIT